MDKESSIEKFGGNIEITSHFFKIWWTVLKSMKTRSFFKLISIFNQKFDKYVEKEYVLKNLTWKNQVGSEVT